MSILNVGEVQANFIKSTTGNTALSIDSSGRVNFSSKPLVHACRNFTASWENFGTTPVIYVYNFVITNAGGHYNATTGKFTCPISGYYKITTAALMGNVGYAYQYHAKNDVSISGNITAHNNMNGNASPAYWTTGYSTIIQCAVNDTLSVYAYTGSTSIYGSGHSNLNIEFLG